MLNKYSVVIPCYNSSSYIEETLFSLLQQTYPCYEVIVVDDFSDDYIKTKHVCNKFNNLLNIKFVRHQYNKNGAAARNTGITLATGDYICFLDSDDIWMDEKIEFIDRIISESSEPKETLFFSQLYMGPRDRKLVDCKIYPTKKFEYIDRNSVGEFMFSVGGLIQTSTIVISREKALDVMFNESFKRHQDYDFVLRSADLNLRFSYIEKPLVKWNIVPGGGNEKSKGEDSNYCYMWYNLMKCYMSHDARSNYLAYTLLPRLIKDGSHIKVIRLLFILSLFTSMKFKKQVFWELVTKFKGVK
ncbi:glycosyltransferase family 2 protein [Vibrio alginolyticus]|uniref:glycosyltransferase family 2 protein n=1 Tax=Vibrio alginolyticus TaxID=663 RepID=UPI0037550861